MELMHLQQKAISGTIQESDLKGGTFTLVGRQAHTYSFTKLFLPRIAVSCMQ